MPYRASELRLRAPPRRAAARWLLAVAWGTHFRPPGVTQCAGEPREPQAPCAAPSKALRRSATRTRASTQERSGRSARGPPRRSVAGPAMRPREGAGVEAVESGSLPLPPSGCCLSTARPRRSPPPARGLVRRRVSALSLRGDVAVRAAAGHAPRARDGGGRAGEGQPARQGRQVPVQRRGRLAGGAGRGARAPRRRDVREGARPSGSRSGSLVGPRRRPPRW